MQAWAGDKPLPFLVMHTAERDDPEPSARGRSDSEAGQAAGLAGALACYGLWLPARARMLLRFVEGRPVSTVTCAFLAWAAERLAAEGVRVLALIWDNAPWHISREVRGWIRHHNRQVKAEGGCRLTTPHFLCGRGMSAIAVLACCSSKVGPRGRWNCDDCGSDR
jgi:hypothetical protein